MDRKEFVVEASRLLSRFDDRRGSIIYSSFDTLRAGEFYILGLNPGGETGTAPPIAESFHGLRGRTGNDYLDEAWEGHARGEARLQRRMKYLFNCILGVELRNVCASNLIFEQTKSAAELDIKLADLCWPIHEMIIDIVRPGVIIAFGNAATKSPYAYINGRFCKERYDDKPSGHGKWKLRKSIVEFEDIGHTATLVGIPHLSRYSPKNKDELLRRWIKGGPGR